MHKKEVEKQIHELINQGKAKPLAWLDIRMSIAVLIMINIIDMAFRIVG